jgi:hypothetical protein
MHFQPMTVELEPCPDLYVLVVGGVVLNQDRSLAAIASSELFEEAEVGGGIEDCFLTVIEPCAPKVRWRRESSRFCVLRLRGFPAGTRLGSRWRGASSLAGSWLRR